MQNESQDATAQVSELVERAARGEEVVVTKVGKPVVRLLPLVDRTPRHPGIARGRLTAAFFTPLPDDRLVGWDQ